MNYGDVTGFPPLASRRIGSTFDAEPGQLESDAAPPWDSWGSSAIVQSGGQAIRLISQHLWGQGRRRLRLPAFLCKSLLTPFGSRSWDIGFYPVSFDLQPDLTQLEIAPGEHGETVVLSAGYFGRQLSPLSAEAMVDLQMRGVSVLEDRTHNLFDWSGPKPDYAFASLRKLLPVGDGAVVTGGLWALDSDESGPGESYWSAMDRKAQGDEGASADSRNLLAVAEARFQRELDPRGASSRTVGMLQTMDYEGMAAARRSNALLLSKRLEGIVRVHPVLDNQVPSHLVVRIENHFVVQQALAAVGIFCPIHWPKPTRVPENLSWPTGMLSLPVDHRYDASDMEYVSTAVKRVIGHD